MRMILKIAACFLFTGCAGSFDITKATECERRGGAYVGGRCYPPLKPVNGS